MMKKKQMKTLLMALPFSLLLSGCQSAELQIPENGITMELGTELPSSVEAYVTAEEYQNITIDNTQVDTGMVGTYTAAVFYKDREAGMVTVHITDTTAPEAKLPESVRLENGTVFSVDDLKADITDFSETQIWFLTDTLSVQELSGTVANMDEENLAKEITVTEDGKYQITILVRDIYGNHNLYPLHIEVYTPDTETPVITADDLAVTLGQEPDYLHGVTATDNVDGDLTDRIQVDTSQVVANKAGTYTIVYSVSDQAGNTGTRECQVTIRNPQKTKAVAKTAEPVKSTSPVASQTQPQPVETPTPTPDSQPLPASESAPEPAVPETPTPDVTPTVTPDPAQPVTPTPTETPPAQPETPSESQTPEATAGFDTARADELLALVNEAREARGVGSVTVKDSLVERAKERAQSGNGSGSGVMLCRGTGAANASTVVDAWNNDYPDGTWMTDAWKYAGTACYNDNGTYTWIVVFGAY